MHAEGSRPADSAQAASLEFQVWRALAFRRAVWPSWLLTNAEELAASATCIALRSSYKGWLTDFRRELIRRANDGDPVAIATLHT